MWVVSAPSSNVNLLQSTAVFTRAFSHPMDAPWFNPPDTLAINYLSVNQPAGGQDSGSKRAPAAPIIIGWVG